MTSNINARLSKLEKEVAAAAPDVFVRDPELAHLNLSEAEEREYHRIMPLDDTGRSIYEIPDEELLFGIKIEMRELGLCPSTGPLAEIEVSNEHLFSVIGREPGQPIVKTEDRTHE